MLALLGATYETTNTGISAGFVIFGIILGIAQLVWGIYWLLDLLKQPDGAWDASGQNKTLWIVIWVVTFCCGFNVILGLVYWFAIRPKLQQSSGPAYG